MSDKAKVLIEKLGHWIEDQCHSQEWYSEQGIYDDGSNSYDRTKEYRFCHMAIDDDVRVYCRVSFFVKE